MEEKREAAVSVYSGWQTYTERKTKLLVESQNCTALHCTVMSFTALYNTLHVWTIHHLFWRCGSSKDVPAGRAGSQRSYRGGGGGVEEESRRGGRDEKNEKRTKGETLAEAKRY